MRQQRGGAHQARAFCWSNACCCRARPCCAAVLGHVVLYMHACKRSESWAWHCDHSTEAVCAALRCVALRCAVFFSGRAATQKWLVGALQRLLRSRREG